VATQKITRLLTLFRLNSAPAVLALVRFIPSPVRGLFLPLIFLGTASG